MLLSASMERGVIGLGLSPFLYCGGKLEKIESYIEVDNFTPTNVFQLEI